ncbi:MAG: 16S rRNA processing protein RimM [Lachnospiraceae bacterium]|nr:16S rRNA processing protein RimM [Lachnospiraceae bacterium]
MQKVLQVGTIIKTHGIRGEVKVYPLTDDVNRFKKLKEVILEPEKDNIILEIEGVKFFKNLVILKFKGFDNINDIEMHTKKGIYVTRENAVECEEDEYFVADLIGLDVVTDENEEFGKVKDVIHTGANDVYVIDYNDKEVLVPAIKQCIKDISIKDNKMTIHLMKGLI